MLVYRNFFVILDWVKIQKFGVMGVNIIMFDFVDLVDFVVIVIKLNDFLQEDIVLVKC